MAFRIRDAFRILRQAGPGQLARFAGERLASYRSFRRWALPALEAATLVRGNATKLLTELTTAAEIASLCLDG